MKTQHALKNFLALMLLVSDFGSFAAAYTSEELGEAVTAGDADEVAALLEDGADPNSVLNSHSGETALMKACWYGQGSVVDVLLKFGANIDHQDMGGDYPTLFAAFHGHNDIVKALCKAGAKVDLQNQSGHTALMIAVCGASLSVRNNEGKNPVDIACAKKKNEEMCDYLTEYASGAKTQQLEHDEL
ncbi:hypothetical protein AB1Y20_008084 [Prymnesium parvum]|uniref:Ankyrin repeat domain-containing protein n=1 Tax=Prymnesium parvum TaxID=97485 RepID=A0AB34ITK5_PRYPA